MTRLHKMIFSLAVVAAAMLTSIGQVKAQTTLSTQTQEAIAAGRPAESAPSGVQVQQGTGAVRYISGGAGASERAEIDAQRGKFPFKVVLSAHRGEYIVADRFVLKSAAGAALDATNLGPLVLIDAPPGNYTLEVTYEGKTRRQQVSVGRKAKQVGIRF